MTYIGWVCRIGSYACGGALLHFYGWKAFLLAFAAMALLTMGQDLCKMAGRPQ